MKITQKHLDILNAVRSTLHPMRHKIVGLNDSKGKHFDALVRFGYLEGYQARTPIIDGHGSFSGSTLIKLTSKGIAEIMEDAIMMETREFSIRVAERVKGLSVPDLISAGVEHETAFYSKVAGVMKDSSK